MKKKYLFVSFILFFIIILIGFGLKTKFSSSLIQNKTEQIGTGILSISGSIVNKKKYNVDIFNKKIEYTENELKILKNFCEKKKFSFFDVKKFNQEYPEFFSKVFLGFDGKKYLAESNSKGGLYFYNNCNFLDKNLNIYAECIVKYNEKNIFTRESREVIQLSFFPTSFINLQKIVQIGNCDELRNNEFKNSELVNDYVTYCKSKDEYLKFLEKKSNSLGEMICRK